MTTAQIKKLLTKNHFYLLGFALLNFASKEILEISLNYRFAYLITIIIYVSGILLFFWNIKPFKKILFYYSLYFITPLLSLLFWLFGGIFLAIITSLVLYPVYPTKRNLKQDQISIYTKYQGLIGACCLYEITEKKYLLFEKKISSFSMEGGIDLEKAQLINKAGGLELEIEQDNAKSDTIIKLSKS